MSAKIKLKKINHLSGWTGLTFSPNVKEAQAIFDSSCPRSYLPHPHHFHGCWGGLSVVSDEGPSCSDKTVFWRCGMTHTSAHHEVKLNAVRVHARFMPFSEEECIRYSLQMPFRKNS